MKTESSPWLHRYAIFVALCAMLAIAAGAVVTSLLRPIAGPIAARPAAAASFEFWHHMTGGITVVLMLGLAIGLSTRLGWIGLGAGILDAFLGAVRVLPDLTLPFMLFLSASIRSITCAFGREVPSGASASSEWVCFLRILSRTRRRRSAR